MNAVLVANEVVNDMLFWNRGVFCKIDMAKTYDHANWVFYFSNED